MDIASFIWISTFGIVIATAVLYCGIFIYRFIRATWNAYGESIPLAGGFSVKDFRGDTNGASSFTIVWHVVGSDVACRNSTLLSFEQLSVTIALFAFFALKPAAPAQGGMS